MKLTKEEIQFIDNYLIKNDIKFWDVRLELLDHIVSAVEDKITTKGISFNEALLEVHRGFGNQFIRFGVHENEIFEKGLYQSNIGFKKFTRRKQKEVGRKYRILTWTYIKEQLASPIFILEYIAFIGLFLGFCNLFPKYTFLFGLLILIIPNIYSIYLYIKDKTTRKSLSYGMATSSTMLSWTLYNLVFYILKDYYGTTEQMPHIIFVIITCVFYPFIRATIKVYRKVYNETKADYKLKF